jgi:hypothetical protein
MVEYYHWQKFDGSFDSICPICIKIIAHAETEEALAELEKYHLCGVYRQPEEDVG